ncbi:isopenicillin N synthase family oxygenase [Vibrio fluvialis]|uniref:isopenicillin N synthase family dioxygenase n=1 Tax=Vibrio fluvialis TaxID=676 RepID=UPI001180A345|nr:2-oxoglutarate and iron-dependent oxygenase domain-containing protein [Vibrio fluvialis]MBL4247247.1 isopenicillin N synthase family oxygenase [Vibrio fluvialis]MBL4255781.1 isopenicillin N synthase family oxygenase [Vibrio fluvialis]MBY8022712.1 isopenicillin N synthase family oxygenase [Vibrio fluvialis]MBY8280058.1 isopenicillin N synthase family oxygenase [Vibrio fluvialis]TRN12887.1 2OG-Fe(II) oxygenase [Vibrio fluvialis]
MTQQAYQLDELNFETTIGGLGAEAELSAIPLIDLSDFPLRRTEIAEQLWQAATEVGFFQLINHGIALSEIEQAFTLSEQFFALPVEQKQRFPLKAGLNAGWEFRQQVRPSTGLADQKESYQITLPHMEALWPEQELVADFQSHLLSMEYQAWQLGMKILSCFADKLGFERDFFTRAHQRDSEHYLSTLRMLHYLPMSDIPAIGDYWRAGAHTDFDCLTMVFQQENQGGLQVAASKDAKQNLLWSNVIPQAGIITCNIGDMLMRWSDDLLKSTLHRVRMPTAEENQGSRYSMAFFCQANRDQIIQGPQQVYPPITAQDYLKMRLNANFA